MKETDDQEISALSEKKKTGEEEDLPADDLLGDIRTGFGLLGVPIQQVNIIFLIRIYEINADIVFEN